MSPEPLPLTDRVDQVCDREIEAGVADVALHASNVREAVGRGLLDGCERWALGAAIGRVLCGQDERKR